MRNYIYIFFALLLISSKAFAQPANDDCSTAISLGSLPTPGPCTAGLQNGAPISVTGTLNGATSESPYLTQVGCGGIPTSTTAGPALNVWYTFVATGHAGHFNLTGSVVNPNIAVWSGNCGNLGGTGGVGGCVVGTAGGTASLTVQQMTIGQTYYIEISGNSPTGAGNFTLTVDNDIDCNNCLLTSTLTATPPPVNGAYTPGQVVHFCYSITSWSQQNTNWAHGIQITFGSGYSGISNQTGMPGVCNGGTWSWYNSCTQSVTPFATFAAGFYFDTSDPGTNPGNNFGDAAVDAVGNPTCDPTPANPITVCWDMTVAAACNPGANLNVTINTSGDGESGSWQDPACVGDPPYVFTAIASCCPPTMTSVAATCVGNDGTATATPVGASGPYDYVWTNSVGTVISTTNGAAGANTVTSLVPGTYTVSLTNAFSCLVTNTVVVGATPPPTTPTASSNSPVCIGSTLNLNSTVVAGATYVWSGPNGFSAATQNTSIPSVTALEAGTYTVTATAGGCSTSSTTTVVISPVPSVTVPANTVVCAGATIPAAAFTSTPAGATYTWTNSNAAIGLAASGTGNIAAFTATNAGATSLTATITVTPTLAGCPGTPSSYTIQVDPTPTVVVPANSTVCDGGTVAAANFTSSVAGATFAWTNSNTATGLAASGIGNIASFIGTNATAAAITSTITVTPTANGCPGTPSTYTITVNPIPTVVVPANIVVCDGGAIAATAFTSPVAGATFVWTNSNTAIGLAASGAGNIAAFTATNASASSISATITVTPTANGCPGTPSSYTITVNPTPTVVVPANITVCDGGTVSATSFTSPVAGTTYTWTNSNTAIGIAASGTGDIASFTATNTSTAPITATIVVTPSAGCTGPTNSYTITVNPTPSVVVPANITVCDGAAIAAANFTSPVAGATFAWSNTNTAIGIAASGTGSIAGYTASNATAAPVTATITVTPTANTCVGTPSSYDITINPVPTVVVPANIIVCNGVAIVATNFTSPVTGATFTWTNSNTAIGLAANGVGNIATFNATNAGTSSITATITVTPSAGCPGIPNTYTITVNPTPTVVVPASFAVCDGSNIAASNFTSPVVGATFDWTNTNTAIGLAASGTGNTPAFTATNATAAPITATIDVTPTANTCVGTPSNYVIAVNPNPQVNAGPDDTICFATSTILNATPNGAGFTYNWLPATGLSNTNTFNPTANPTVNTTYTVTITSAAGCVGSDSVTIYSDQQIIIAKTEFDVTCNGACNGQAIVIPSGGAGVPYTYLWTNADTTASITGLCPGSYSVTVTDAWGCTATVDTLISEPTAVVATVTGQTPTSCNGICDGTATSSGSGGTPGAAGYSYSWNSAPAQSTAIANSLCASLYVVTVTDANGCQDTAHVTIIQPSPVMVLPIQPQTICIGSSTTITAIASGGNGGYNYAWLPAGTAGNIATITVSPTVTNSYTVNVTDANGCTAPAVIAIVNVNPPLSVVASGATSICPGVSAPISAIATGGDGGPYNYAWGPVGTGNGTPINVTPGATTTYTVTATDGCGTPFALDSVTITILPLPIISFTANATSGCSPLCINFTDATAIASGTITSWSWNFDGAGNANSQNPSTCFTNNQLLLTEQYSITLTATSAAGCSTTDSIPNMITVFPIPDAQFTTSPNPTTVLNTIVTFTDQSSADVNYWDWGFGDGAGVLSSTQNPIHEYPNTLGYDYMATLLVQNSYGCIDTISHVVQILPEFTFFIPNAFTPNGDGINDYFNGTGIGIEEYEMYVFDRWGNMIYYTDSLFKPWDGKANHGDEMAQQDVYVWKVRLTDVFDKKHNYIGTVTIVK